MTHKAQTDMLEEIFRMQEQLNSRIAPECIRCATNEEKAKWLLNFSRAAQQELAELVDSMPWKWWAKYQKFDEQNARVEIVDLIHFIISMALVLGMTPEDVFQAYVKKHSVNNNRQNEGYAEKKEDCKHI